MNKYSTVTVVASTIKAVDSSPTSTFRLMIHWSYRGPAHSISVALSSPGEERGLPSRTAVGNRALGKLLLRIFTINDDLVRYWLYLCDNNKVTFWYLAE